MTADRIIYGILSTYERHGWHHPSITMFVADVPRITGENCIAATLHNFHPAASARNIFCKNYKDSKFDWLCMIDNDMVLPPPEKLLKTVKDAPKDAGIVVPRFYLWDQGSLTLGLCWGMGDTLETSVNTLDHLDPGFHELSKCGTGVIFIRPWVFQKIEYPYFTYLYNSDAGMDGTEDIQFCLRVRQAGIKIYGNADVVVGHMHSVELSSLNNWFDKCNRGIRDFGQDTGRSPVCAADTCSVEAT